jgi:hypothetical protein
VVAAAVPEAARIEMQMPDDNKVRSLIMPLVVMLLA